MSTPQQPRTEALIRSPKRLGRLTRQWINLSSMRKLAHDFLWFAMDRCGGRSHKCEPRAQKKAAQHEVINLFRKKLVTTRGFNIDPPADRQTSECRSVWMKISLQAADKVNR